MKQMVITILTSFLLAPGAATDDISGIWLTQKKDSRIEITRNSDGSFTGKIIWVEAPHQNYVGTTVMRGVEYDPSKGLYTCPWVYDPRLNMSAHAVITLNGDTMSVNATKGVIKKKEIFIRTRQGGL